MMNKLKIAFSKNERANQIIDIIFVNRIRLVNELPTGDEKFEAELCLKQDAAYVASFLTIWFSYTSLSDDHAFNAALRYLRDKDPLPLASIPPHRLIIWDKLFDEDRIKVIIGKLRLESAITGEA